MLVVGNYVRKLPVLAGNILCFVVLMSFELQCRPIGFPRVRSHADSMGPNKHKKDSAGN